MKSIRCRMETQNLRGIKYEWSVRHKHWSSPCWRILCGILLVYVLWVSHILYPYKHSLSSLWLKLPFVSNTDLGLLFFMCAVTKQLKKCWGEYIRGFYRKICETTEIHEVLCENGRYCCLSIMELEALKNLPEHLVQSQWHAFTFPQEYYAYEQNYTNSKKSLHQSSTIFC